MAGFAARGAMLRKGPNPLVLAYFVAFSSLVLGGAALAIFGDPHAGDPVVRLKLREAWPSGPSAGQAGARTKIPTPFTTDIAAPPPIPPALVPPTIGAPIFAGKALIADPALVEPTAAGPLPRVADNGRTPMAAYAPPLTIPADRPKIGIVIGGLGISAKATASALATLPPGVTLSFAPYAGDVRRWVGEARKDGHEVLLEVPMEPYDFPDSDPGPHTLRSGAAEDANTERLVWALTRFTGYTGVTNLLGGRFMSDAPSLEPIMTYLARRGLLFFDNGTAAHSAAPDVAARVGVPFAQSTTTIDTVQTPEEIDRQLSALEAEAHAHGHAVGAGFIYPVTIARVTVWAQGLPGRGFALVPASAIVATTKSP